MRSLTKASVAWRRPWQTWLCGGLLLASIGCNSATNSSSLSPADVELRSLAKVHVEAIEQLTSGDESKADELFMDASSKALKLLEKKPNLSEDEKGFLSEILFDAATAYARKQQAEQALTLLVKSEELGFADINSLLDDPSLESVRQHANFSELENKFIQSAAKRSISTASLFEFDFELPDQDGASQSLKQWRGNVVIVAIWGSPFPSCIDLAPSLGELQRSYFDRGVRCVGINYEGEGRGEIGAIIRDFRQKNGIDFPCLIGDDALKSKVPDFQVYPTLLVIDPQGKVISHLVGAQHPKLLSAILDQLTLRP